MAQVSLGEIVAPKRDGGTPEQRARAFDAINSKRVDLAVFDPALTLRLIVEYQGSGHYQEDAILRDAIKREALRRAGVPMLEVEQGYQPEAVREALRARLGLGAPGRGADEAVPAGQARYLARAPTTATAARAGSSAPAFGTRPATGRGSTSTP